MTDRYEVRLRKAVHVFSAGHFITLTDELCEPVHGHNWTVGVDVAGTPDRHGMVVDFIALRDAVGRVLAHLDHKMLLPSQNEWLTVANAPGPHGHAETTVTFRDRRRWVFPADECVLLPLANTTAEWLARWIGVAVTEALAAAGHEPPPSIRVSVDECLGQAGVWERASSE
jgi:6-pyruvoyltetrahydropterin/6-carboxytetrahydropterin synthase